MISQERGEPAAGQGCGKRLAGGVGMILVPDCDENRCLDAAQRVVRRRGQGLEDVEERSWIGAGQPEIVGGLRVR